jgi:hypothetical protein
MTGTYGHTHFSAGLKQPPALIFYLGFSSCNILTFTTTLSAQESPRAGVLITGFGLCTGRQTAGLAAAILRTSNKNIFAAGDIGSPFHFTHAAEALGRIALQNALFFGRNRASDLVIPWCTYTSPEIEC